MCNYFKVKVHIVLIQLENITNASSAKQVGKNTGAKFQQSNKKVIEFIHIFHNDRLCTYEAIWSALLHNGNIIFYYYWNKASTSDKKQKPKKGDDKNEKVC